MNLLMKKNFYMNKFDELKIEHQSRKNSLKG